MSPHPSSRPAKKKDFQNPAVVFQPEAAEGLQAGFDQLVNLVRPTLGPLPHIVAIEKIAGRDSQPERLDSAGTIARRVVQIQDRNEDVGLMYLRHVLWKLQESEGDGTATAAVMFQVIYNQGRRYVAAGGNAMGLRQHFEKGMLVLLDALERQTVQLQGRHKLAGLARSICYDDALSRMLGEVFDIIGAYGRLEVRQSPDGEMNREYVEGMYWESGLRSREMANADYGMRANLENPAILISDLEIETPQQLVPLLNLAVQNNIKQVLLVSRTLSEKAMSILLAKPNQERVHVVAVKIPGVRGDVQQNALEDLAVLTGGRALLQASGETLERVRLEDLGRARRAWADKEFFGIIGGRGNPRLLRAHIANLRALYKNAHTAISPSGPAPDGDDSARLLERLGKLMGGSATLLVGDISPSAIDARIELAKRAAGAMRGAMREGVVPGGGVALLNCREPLRACLKAAASTDERAAYTILLKAIEAPFRAILENAGLWPGRTLAEMDQLGPEYGYDVLARKVVKMSEAGLFDAAPVVKGAVRAAVAGSALALTTEAIVHRRNPPEGLHT
jgi:chaperonin GroEL